ncbi:hypothetical protein [Parapedobacter pyrenivorans]|nr:hypothetical protein [Parapedobacter pyrenivorans]
MNKIESYPIFEADQVLTNNHLNDTVNYLDRQSRLSRVRLIGNGIVCGLEITVADEGIVISGGHGITSQGYLIEHCQQEYTHYTGYISPDIPTGLNLITGCGDGPESLPYYGVEGIFELLPPDSQVTAKTPISTLKAYEYVVVLLLEAKQVRLKNCDTNDCNDKGGRLDFEVKPLLVHSDLLNGSVESVFNTILLKRYGVPVGDRLENGEQVLQAFYDIVDNDTLDRLGQNLNRCWDRYAHLLGLPESNPFEKLDLKVIRDKHSYQNGNFHYIQYFYDFIDDLVKAFGEFTGKAQDFFGGCRANEGAFPLHLLLGLASESTQFGHWDNYRQYFVPVHYLYGQRHLKEEVTQLLQRLKYMVEEFDSTLPSKNQLVAITPSYIGKESLSDRCIPFYYRRESLDQWWDFQRNKQGNGRMARGTGITISPIRNTTGNVLLYDIERFNAFRIEGHVGKRYSTALAEIVTERDRFNLPFDVVALSAVDLKDITNGNEVTCNVQDLESNYNVLIAGLLCRVEQILTYVGSLRPKRDVVIGDVLVADTINVGKIASLPTFSKKVSSIKKEVAAKKKVTTQPVSEKVNYIGRVVDLDTDDTEIKLMDFVAKDINAFLVTDRKLFEYVLPKPDLLLVFLQQLNAILGYLFEHDLPDFKVDAYNALWADYQSTVNSIIKESANSQNEALKEYFAPKNNNVLFNCANEELYAIREEYNERLNRYQEAVTFAKYFEKHKGLEHKAGVPKGGTFVLVYQPPAARYSAIIPERDLRLVAQPIEGSQLVKSTAAATKAIAANTMLLGSNRKIYTDAVSLIEQLNLGTAASKVLDALKKREEEEKQVSQLPNGVVIADFYVPYVCKSDCPPIAYVFPTSPDEPSEPGKPDEHLPTVSIEPTVFCIADKKEYPIKTNPEGGKLTINDKESEPKIVPARLGAGTFKVAYILESGAVAATQFVVQEKADADFGISAATYSEREGNWNVTLKSIAPNADTGSTQWLMDGKPIAADQSEVTQLLTPNNPKSAITYAIRESICGAAERTRTFIREDHTRTIGSDAASVTIPVKTSGVINLVAAPKGVVVKDGALVIPAAQLMKEGMKSAIIAYHYPNGDEVILAVLTVTLGTAAFEMVIGVPDSSTVLTRRGAVTAVNIALKALSDGGTSKWTVNGKAAKATASIPLKEFDQLKELVITHQIEFGDGSGSAVKTFTQSITALRKQLEASKGKIIVE